MIGPIVSLRASPPTPWVGSTESGEKEKVLKDIVYDLLRSITTLLLFTRNGRSNAMSSWMGLAEGSDRHQERSPEINIIHILN